MGFRSRIGKAPAFHQREGETDDAERACIEQDSLRIQPTDSIRRDRHWSWILQSKDLSPSRRT